MENSKGKVSLFGEHSTDLQPFDPRMLHSKAAPVSNLCDLCNGIKQVTRANFEKNWTVP
jgi:hypothetical protein